MNQASEYVVAAALYKALSEMMASGELPVNGVYDGSAPQSPEPATPYVVIGSYMMSEAAILNRKGTGCIVSVHIYDVGRSRLPLMRAAGVINGMVDRTQLLNSCRPDNAEWVIWNVIQRNTVYLEPLEEVRQATITLEVSCEKC